MSSWAAEPLQARFVSAGDGPAYRVISDLVTFKALAADTGGSYSLLEGCTQPGQGMPPHFKRYEDEAFWVLEGTYSFMLDGRLLDLRPGDYVFVPRGAVHGFTNTGATPARLLVLLSPGGIYERFFAEIGKLLEPAAAPPVDSPDLAQILVAAQKYGIEFVPAQAI